MRACMLSLSLVLTIAFVADASAALLAYEPFDYTPVGSDLLGKNGGQGFVGAWTAGGFNASIHNNYDIQSGSLSFGNLLTSGNRVQTGAVQAIAGITRDLPPQQDDEPIYISFLIRPEGTLNQGAFNGFFGVNVESATEPELYLGKPGSGPLDRWVLEDRGGTRQHASAVGTFVNSTALLVLKVEPAIGNDKWTLYVNPTPGAAEPLSGVVKNDSNFGLREGLALYSTGAFSIDELRVGETFADVTPVPEPSSLLLLLGGAATLLAAGRRFANQR